MKGCFCSDKKRWSEILKEKSKYFWVKQAIEKFSLKIGSDKFSIKHVLGAIELFLISTRIIGSGKWLNFRNQLLYRTHPGIPQKIRITPTARRTTPKHAPACTPERCGGTFWPMMTVVPYPLLWKSSLGTGPGWTWSM